MRRFAVGCIAFGLALAAFSAEETKKPVAPNLGEQVPPFALKDTKGKTLALADLKDKRALVVVFLGTECPLNNSFMPALVALQKEFADKGVQVVGINSNSQDRAEHVARHAERFGLTFPVLKDEDNKVADQFQARRTPEAFVLDSGRRIRYRGRIDDQYGIGFQRPKPTRRDVAVALEEVLAGKEVTQPVTEVDGCLIGRASEPKKSGTVTFTKHISRLVQKHCQECHRPGQIGPMALLDYEDLVAWSATIAEVIDDGRMPPWLADPKHGKFANERRLNDEEKQLVHTWIKEGTPRGNESDLPAPRQWPKDWAIGKPDMVIEMPEEFAVPAETPPRGVPYKFFTVPFDFKEDRWVTHVEARPGAPEVVHHILVFLVPPGERFFPGNPKTPVLGGTAPGNNELILPAQTGKHIPVGSKLIFQLHYTPNGRAVKDRSSVALRFAKEKPKFDIRTVPIFQFRFAIPPGADNYEVESSFTFRNHGHVVLLMPHMHLRGKDFFVEAIYPDGKKETLLSVPRWDFNWQISYRLAQPKPVPKGTKIHCVAHFDNSAKNPNNPDPTRTVFWGDQTWQEMMIGWMEYYYDE